MADLSFWKVQNKKVFDRIFSLLDSISDSPFSGIGKPGPLKNNLAGYWLRRITKEHRLVYRVENNIIYLVSCRYHYEK